MRERAAVELALERSPGDVELGRDRVELHVTLVERRGYGAFHTLDEDVGRRRGLELADHLPDPDKAERSMSPITAFASGRRATRGDDTISGYALSLKIGGLNVIVDGYSSPRPDGFIDVLTSHGLTISNVTTSYDPKFQNAVSPNGALPQSPVGP